VVFGGEVRDVFFNEQIADLDVTVKVALTPDELDSMQSTIRPANQRVLDEAMQTSTDSLPRWGRPAMFLWPLQHAKKYNSWASRFSTRVRSLSHRSVADRSSLSEHLWMQRRKLFSVR
ncbi:MAG: hypothetical protein AAB263_15240, partial [Planctomycetota bacterium]